MAKYIQDAISKTEFNSVNQCIYAIYSGDRLTGHFLTKDSAYTEMESILKRQLAADNVERVDYHDLDARADRIVCKNDETYELTQFSISY